MLNKWGDNIQPWCTPFPSLNQSIVPCSVLTVAAWSAYRFLSRQARWSGISISKNFPQFVVIHTVKGFHVVNEAEVYIFLELPCFLHDSMNVDNLFIPLSLRNPAYISRSSRVMYCWSLAWRTLSITLLACEMSAIVRYFEHSLALPFFGIGMKAFSSFPNFLAYWVQHFHSIIF